MECRLTEVSVVEALVARFVEMPGGARRGAHDASGEDIEGARLVALNMALNGTSREETDQISVGALRADDRQRLLGRGLLVRSRTEVDRRTRDLPRTQGERLFGSIDWVMWIS